LGLGRAYVAVADDAYAIFQNPAGLARIAQLQITSMYCKLIDEVDYALLGAAHPLNREALGVSFVRASVGGSLLSKRDPVTDRIVPDGEGAIGYASSVAFLTYSLAPEKYSSAAFFKNLYLGTSLKIFSQSLTGVPNSDVTALGYDLDVGLLYQPNSFLTLGLAGYNVLPYSMGGKLIWGSGIAEGIPASGKVGGSLKVLGPGGMRDLRFESLELYLNFDHEFTTLIGRPGLNHLGAEWVLSNWISFRAGLDQDAVALGGGAVGTQTNLAAGLGITAFNFRFDYAFHTFGELAENNTHFLSLSYGVEKKRMPPPPPPPITEYLTVEAAADQNTIYDPYFMVKGRVLYPDQVKNLLINESPANLYPDGNFFYLAPLPELGGNRITLKAISLSGRILETKEIKIRRLGAFSDIPPQDPLRQTLGALAALGYVSGNRDQTFGPDNKISRGTLMSLLAKTGKDSILLRSYSYKPGALTRAEAAAILVKFAQFEEPDYVYEQPFADVPLKYWAVKPIYLAKKHGLLNFVKDQYFKPAQQVTRREVIEMLIEIDYIKNKLVELFNS